MIKKRPTKPEQEACSASIHVNFPLTVPGERPKIFWKNHSTPVINSTGPHVRINVATLLNDGFFFFFKNHAKYNSYFIYPFSLRCKVVELDAHDLTPTRLWSWNELNPSFQGVHAGPHSHYDATRGELINFNMEYHALGTKYNFFMISQKHPKGELIASVTAKSSYVHSFAVTPRFIILVCKVIEWLVARKCR